MPGEKQNSIRQKFDQMQTVPEGFHFDENCTWLKLEAAIPNKNKQKIYLWLPAALLLLSLTKLIFIHDKQLTTNQLITTTLPPEKQKSGQKIIVSAARKETAKIEKVLGHKIILPHPEMMSDKKDTGSVFFQPEQVPVITQPFLSATDTVAIVAVSQKPKFKIAHVNELYAPQAVLPASQKTGFAFSLRTSSVTADEPLLSEEKVMVQKKQKTFFSSLLNSSQ